MGTLLLLSLRQTASRTRILIVLLLTALPISLAVLVSILARDEPDFSQSFTDILVDGMLITVVLPIVMMALATAAFGNELDDRTLSYLVLKPIARSKIVVPKLLAAIIVGGPLMIASGVVVALLGFEGNTRAAAATGAALLTGVVTYAAIFTWAGLVSARALAFALLYVFLWEGLISGFLEGVRYMSVRGYTVGVLHGVDGVSFGALSDRAIELPAAVVGAVMVTVIFFLLTVLRLRGMDVP